MSLIQWGVNPSTNDYYYIRVTLTTYTAYPGASFAYGYNNQWYNVPGITDISRPYPNYYSILLVNGTILILWGPVTDPQDQNAPLNTNVISTPVSNQYYIKMTWKTNFWELTPLSNDPIFVEAPCFSFNTLGKLCSNVNRNKFLIIHRSYRQNKKMYRLNHPIWGDLEFTEDHPFIYKKKRYDFGGIIDIYSKSKNLISEVSYDDNDCGSNNFIYNIFYNPQFHPKNVWKIDDELVMVGGFIRHDEWDYMKKKIKNIILLSESNIEELKNKKISLNTFLSNLKNIPEYIDNILLVNINNEYYAEYYSTCDLLEVNNEIIYHY
jgi:hypothetical protein